MKDKWIIILGFIILIPLILLLIFLLTYNKPEKSPVTVLEDCNVLEYNGVNAINLVFFADESDAKIYSDFIFTIPPFDKNKANFNVYYIQNYTPKCELYENIAVLCYSKDIIKKASSCPNDYIIILKKEDSSIRSSAYMNIMSLNKNHALTVFAHEFGHAFANLAEEYTPAEIPRGAKNCQSTCEKFENKSESCSQGCSKESYFRSIELGIMRTLNSNTFGKFNEALILEKISIKSNKKITGKVINSETNCQSQKYYLIEGNYSGNKINILDKNIEIGCLGSSGSGSFTYNLTFDDNKQITEDFNPELIFTDVQIGNQETIEGQTFASDKTFLLKIPIIPNSKLIEIRKGNEKLAEIRLDDIGARPCKI